MPSSGRVSGGYSVTVVGSNFHVSSMSDVSVTLADVAATVVDVTPSAVVVTAGAAVSNCTGNVTVSSYTFGTGVAVNAFTYNPRTWRCYVACWRYACELSVSVLCNCCVLSRM